MICQLLFLAQERSGNTKLGSESIRRTELGKKKLDKRAYLTRTALGLVSEGRSAPAHAGWLVVRAGETDQERRDWRETP